MNILDSDDGLLRSGQQVAQRDIVQVSNKLIHSLSFV